jgi:hypothetical protein
MTGPSPSRSVDLAGVVIVDPINLLPAGNPCTASAGIRGPAVSSAASLLPYPFCWSLV